MKIHAIETGKVQITQSLRIGRGDGINHMVHTHFDSEYTEWFPIYVWLFEHAEGLIVIDTGIPADANKRVWFPPFMPLIQRAARFRMAPELEIDPQLRPLVFHRRMCTGLF